MRQLNNLAGAARQGPPRVLVRSLLVGDGENLLLIWLGLGNRLGEALNVLQLLGTAGFTHGVKKGLSGLGAFQLGGRLDGVNEVFPKLRRSGANHFYRVTQLLVGQVAHVADIAGDDSAGVGT